MQVFDYADRCAVVTGGGSGIGAALAAALAQRGAHVAVADISGDDAAGVAARIGPAARAYQCDVSDIDSVRALRSDVARDFRSVNFLFANAGVFIEGPLHETRPEELAWLFDVNVKGVYNAVHTFAPMLLEQGAKQAPARVVMTGSENSLGLPFQGVMSAYTATKHAVMAIADALRRDLEGTGVGVTIICSGAVDTRIWDARRARPDQYGGAAAAPQDLAERAAEIFRTIGQRPDVTARLCLEAVEQDRFLVIADAKIGDYARKRHDEVLEALDWLAAQPLDDVGR